MRLVVMFDLPTGNKAERKSYADFRKFLIDDGYTMYQFSVYTRIALSRDNAETHLERLRANLPLSGTVTAFCLTEKQFESRAVLVNTREEKQMDVGAQLTLAF